MGVRVKSIDARGNATLFDFADRYGSPDGNARLSAWPTELSSVSQYSYAFPSLVTNALAHTTYTQSDYYLGRPIDVEDANGTTYSGYFNDLLDRPTQVISAPLVTAVKTQSTFAYDDINRIVTVTNDQTAFGDNLLKTQTLFDGLGRTIESRQYEGGTNYIVTKQEYDALGRAYKQSNP